MSSKVTLDDIITAQGADKWRDQIKYDFYHQPNQLRRELVGICGLIPFLGKVSASRLQMASSQLGQTLVPRKPTIRRIQTGMEREYGKYTFSVKMPADGTILMVVNQYQQGVASRLSREPTGKVVIYERESDKQIGVIELPRFSSQHPYFGFEYQKTKHYHRAITVGETISAGTVFLNSPLVTEDGDYMMGVEANVAYMTHPSTSEDGYMMRRNFLKEHFVIRTLEKRTIGWGGDMVPLNLYPGPNGEYGPWPAIGEMIRPDGIIMAVREMDPYLGPVEQSVEALKNIDFVYDKVIRAGDRTGKVVDIKIYHNGPIPADLDPITETDALAYEYTIARRKYHQELYEFYQKILRIKGGNVGISLELSNLFLQAINVVGHNSLAPKDPIHQLYRHSPMDQWRIEITVECLRTPNLGNKFTNTVAGKGVACNIVDDDEMPVDALGRRADIVKDPAAIINRMIPGVTDEVFINAVGSEIVQRARADLDVTGQEKNLFALVEEIADDDPVEYEAVRREILDFYQIISPKQYGWFVGTETEKYRKPFTQHLAIVLKNDTVIYYPPENPIESLKAGRALQERFKPTYGPVRYRAKDGTWVTTHDNIRIGSEYNVILEKIANDAAAVSSGKVQHHGVLSQATGIEKYSTPIKANPVKALDESTMRIYVSFIGGIATAKIHDHHNNPVTHRLALNAIYESKTPAAIPNMIDYSHYKLGGDKPRQLTRHLFLCAGVKVSYRPGVRPVMELTETINEDN